MAKQGASEYDPGQRYEVKVHEVEYRRDGKESWQARIYQPRGPGQFPALVDVHGGVWNMGDRMNDELIDGELAASGIVVAAVDFRLAPEHPYPAQVADVNYASRWLKAHATEFNADASSIGGLGASSGAHTVLLSAMRPRDPRYAALPLPEAPETDATLRCVLSLWGVIDPHARYLYAQKVGRADLVARSEAYFLTEDAMREGNPQLILERSERVELPPVLIIEPIPDDNVPTYIPQRFVEAYRAAGGAIEIEQFQGSYHGFGREASPNTDRALAVMKAFVARQLATRLAGRPA